jgi:hypothetical protein
MNMTVSLRTPGALLHHGEAAALSARAEYGAFGMLPNHADVAIALAPSVLSLREADGSERVFGIDEGLLVKRGDQVSSAARSKGAICTTFRPSCAPVSLKLMSMNAPPARPCRALRPTWSAALAS